MGGPVKAKSRSRGPTEGSVALRRKEERSVSHHVQRALDRLEHLARQKGLGKKPERLRRLGAFGGLRVDQPRQENRRQPEFLPQQACELDPVDRSGQPDVDEGGGGGARAPSRSSTTAPPR